MAGNEQSLALAFEWLNQGYHLALTSGTDTHGPEHNRIAQTFGFDVVYANDLSESEILHAVQQGHLYMSAGPTLELYASAAETLAIMGDVLDVADDSPIQVTARWRIVPFTRSLSFIVDGVPQQTQTVPEDGSDAWKLPGGQVHWCLVTIRDQQGVMLALTNPIFFDGRSKE